jgi:serine/threonine-protein kinase
MSVPVHLTAAVADRYVVDREIGRGGMATVYLARDVRHDRYVALKLLDPEIGAVLGVDRFLAEIRVTANLQHPNLLPLFDSGEANGQPFYVMPYVEGESLRQRITREKQLPVDEAIRISVAVASAVEYAHAHGVIHRDLKPENILLQAGQPVVADFGIALAVSKAGGARITQTGLSLGTPQYMSPEQATGDRAIDGRSDIYSLAAVTYEMLTGDPPHTGSTMQAVIARVLTEPPRAVRAVRPSVPEFAAFAIERALEKLPADRWATAREFADALQGRAVGSTPTAKPGTRETSPTDRRGVFARARDPVVLGALAVAVVGVAVGLWGWQRDLDRDEGTTVRYTIAPASADREIPLASQIAISPDGKVVAYIARDAGGVQHLVLRESSQLSERIVPGTNGAITPAFSPDGAWLAFALLGGGGLKKVAVTGGPVVAIADATAIQGLSWVRDDIIVASVGDTLMTVSAAGGRLQPLRGANNPPEGELGRRSPRVLADGETVLYQSWRGGFADSRIGVLSLATGESAILDIVGASPIGVIEGQLLYGTPTGTVMAVPFDIRRRRITGTPIPVVEQVDIGPGPAGFRAAVSHTGSLVYAIGARNSQVVLADMQGTARVLIAEPRSYSSPRFSPDGTRLAVGIQSGAASDIWIYDLTSSTLVKLTSEGERNERPEWTSDGKRVLFTSNRGGKIELWWQNADLSGSAERVQVEPTPISDGLFSPNGQTLMYWLIVSRNQPDIFYRALSGDTARKSFAETPAVEVSPKFSPDGKWVAYGSNPAGTLQVFVQPFPPTGARYQVTATGGMTPTWSRDGNRIFYVANSRLNVAAIKTSPVFAVTSRTSLFEGSYLLNVPPHANYDISPDGKNFVLLRPVETGDQLMVVHDWKYELRERTRAPRRK